MSPGTHQDLLNSWILYSTQCFLTLGYKPFGLTPCLHTILFCVCCAFSVHTSLHMAHSMIQ